MGLRQSMCNSASNDICTVAYLGHGEKTNYSANPPGRNTNPPGRNSQSARAKY